MTKSIQELQNDVSIDIASRYKHVLQPLQIAGVTLPNRIVRTAHQTGLAIGETSDDLIAYHVARARGGVGMSIVETVSIHPTSPMFLDFSTDAAIESMAKLVDAVAPYGMKLFQQLWHGGANAMPIDGSPPWSASPYPVYMDYFISPRVPIEMTKAMIDTIVEAFRDAAIRSVKSGMDGLEIHAGHGYLPMQFLSPITNRRSDDYGGSLDNRMRLLVEILTAIRSAVDTSFPIGVRLSSTDFYQNGLAQEEVGTVVARLQDLNLLDFVDLSIGTYHVSHMMMGTAFEERGYQLKFHEGINEKTTVPRIVTGRVMTLDDAERILSEGKAELVSMVRATIADPDLVRKSLTLGTPRPCISCNVCSSTVATGMRCSVNTAVGFEAKRSVDPQARTSTSKYVVIAGGGPGGMEIARIAAKRGHRVTLFEARSNLGGQVSLAASIPGRKDMGRIVTWYSDELRTLDVDVQLSTPLTKDLISSLGPIDLFVNATGPRQREQLLQTAIPMLSVPIENPNLVKSSWDILAGAEVGNGRHAVVLDDAGYFEGAGVALELMDKGWQVTVVARTPQIAPETYSTHHNRLLRERLTASGNFSFMPYSYIASIGSRSTEIHSLMEGVPAQSVECDLVVPVMFHQPNPSIGTLAGAHANAVETIGDALAPHRLIVTATREAHKVSLQL